MKAAVITLQNIKNYGSMLQAFATQELLKREGIESVMIDYTRPDALFWNHIFGYSKHNNLLVGIVKSLILLPTEIRYKFLWDSFKKKHLQSTHEKYTTLEELSANPPVADIYCSGSDQVWNSGWNGGLLKEFFLEFAPKDKKRYALASSIGMSKFDESEMPELSRLLNEYEAISVRETSGLELVKSLGASNAINVIDPTLTVDSTFWKQLATAPKRKNPYILIYQLGKDPNIDKYARHMAEKTGLEVVRICIRYDYALRYGKSALIPSFEEFLTLFANADYVITDSFHATCFSLNFNKKFWCILPDMYQGRILDLLKMMSLEERVVGSDFNNVDIHASIGYDRVNEILNKERSKVAAFYRSIAE